MTTNTANNTNEQNQKDMWSDSEEPLIRGKYHTGLISNLETTKLNKSQIK